MFVENDESKKLLIAGHILAFFVLILSLLIVWRDWPVFAEDARPCVEDITNFCKDVKPGGGRIITCLKSHEGELSSVCKDKLQELQKRVDIAKQVCTNDIGKFFKGVEPGEGRIARCLEEHTPELSPTCAEQMDWVKAKLKRK